MEGAAVVGERRGKLTERHHALPDMLHEIHLRRQDAAGVGLAREQADPSAEAQAHRPNRGEEIAVVAQHGRAVEAMVEGIEQQLRGEVDVGSFFLGAQDRDRAGCGGGEPEGVSLLRVASSKSQPFAARHPSAQPATGRPLRSCPGRSHAYTWIVIAVRLSSTKTCSAKADSSLPRLAANSCPISSLEMFPVETSSKRGG